MQPIDWRFSMFLVLAIGFGGCGSPSRDIVGRDHGTLLPALRTVINVRGEAREGGRSRPVTELEVDIAGADGDIRRSGVKVGEYTMVEGGVAMRFGRAVRDRIQFVGISGLGINRLELEDRSGFPLIDDGDTEAGIRLGGELRVKIAPWLSGHARLMSFLRPFDFVATQTEIAFVFGNPHELGFLIGFKEWRYDDESSELEGVDEIDLRVDGLFLALDLRF